MPRKSLEHAPRVAQPTTAVQIVPGVPHINVYNLSPVESGLTAGQVISIVAIVAAMVTAIGSAWWQSKLQRRQLQHSINLQGEQLKHSMYEKRFEVYLGVRKFIGTIVVNLQPDIPDAQLLLRETQQAEWLFRPEIKQFIENELYKKAIKLRTLNRLYEANTITQPQIDEMNDLCTWFGDTAPVAAQELFAEYLKLTEEPTEDVASVEVNK